MINFNVQPELKPLKPSLLKESTYSKVLINATNMHHLTKNEKEYLSNLFDVSHDMGPDAFNSSLVKKTEPGEQIISLER